MMNNLELVLLPLSCSYPGLEVSARYKSRVYDCFSFRSCRERVPRVLNCETSFTKGEKRVARIPPRDESSLEAPFNTLRPDVD